MYAQQEHNAWVTSPGQATSFHNTNTNLDPTSPPYYSTSAGNTSGETKWNVGAASWTPGALGGAAAGASAADQHQHQHHEQYTEQEWKDWLSGLQGTTSNAMHQTGAEWTTPQQTTGQTGEDYFNKLRSVGSSVAAGVTAAVQQQQQHHQYYATNANATPSTATSATSNIGGGGNNNPGFLGANLYSNTGAVVVTASKESNEGNIIPGPPTSSPPEEDEDVIPADAPEVELLGDFDASSMPEGAGDFLSCKRGEIVKILEENLNGWTMVANAEKEKGWIPTSFFRRKDQSPGLSSNGK